MQGLPSEAFGNSRVVIGGIKVDELDDTVGMHHRKAGQLVSGERVASENDPLNFQGVEELPNVLDQRSGVVAGLCGFRFAVAAPGESEHAKLVGEPGCEVVIKMRRAAHSMQKQKGVSRAAPIQIMELHVVDG